MRPFHFISALAFLVLTAACASKPPTSPTLVEPTATGLAIRGTDALLTGTASDYSATATLTDGTVRPVTPAWTSSNPAVARVVGRHIHCLGQASFPIPTRRMKLLPWTLAAAALVVGASVAVVAGGHYDVAANTPHWQPVTARHNRKT